MATKDTKDLMEAAADVLNQSRKNASAEPMHKLDAEVVDLGGPKNTDANPLDDSEKIDATKAAKKATAPTTHPSNASAKIEKMKEDVENEDEDSQLDFQEDVQAIFADENLSEDFKIKVSTIFEARVLDRVAQIQEELEEQYNNALADAVESITEDLEEKIDDHLNYVVEQWLDENQIAIESGLRSELTEEFISGLRNLFAEHYIEVPEEKVNLVDELAGKVEELEDQLNEEIERGISYKKSLNESRKELIMQDVCEGLTTTQAEKIEALAESVVFTTEDEYQEKLAVIRENYFPTGRKKVETKHLHEELHDADEKKYVDPMVQAVAGAISRTKK